MLEFVKTVVRGAPNLEQLELLGKCADVLCKEAWLQELVSKLLFGTTVRLVCHEIRCNLSNMPANCLQHLAVRSMRTRYPLMSGCEEYLGDPKEQKVLLRNSQNTLEFAEVYVALLAEIILDGAPFTVLEELPLRIDFALMY